MYRGQTQFRPPTWQLIAVILVDVGASAGAVLYWNAFGIDWVFGGLVLVAVVAGAGIFEVLTTGVALGESEMQVRQRGRFQTIARADIQTVTWESGCPVALLLQNGDWVKLPEVGRNTQALANSVRAWVKAA